MKHQIYEPYVTALATSESMVASHLKGRQAETIRKPTVSGPRDRITNALRKARILVNRGLDIVTGRAIAVPNIPVR